MSPSWDPAIPQAMQQHGGRNRYPAQPQPQPGDEAAPAAPRGTSLQVVAPTSPVIPGRRELADPEPSDAR